MRGPIRTLGLTLGGVVVVGLVASVGGQSVIQPIAFNHRIHVQDVEIECTDCHLHAVDGVRATIPNIELCAECHEEPVSDSAEEALAVDYIQEGVPIPWRKIYVVPDHVYFSHRRHTQVAEIECRVCHGDMEDRNDPLTRSLVNLNMDACMRCHEQEGASNDCVHCHQCEQQAEAGSADLGTLETGSRNG